MIFIQHRNQHVNHGVLLPRSPYGAFGDKKSS